MRSLKGGFDRQDGSKEQENDPALMDEPSDLCSKASEPSSSALAFSDEPSSVLDEASPSKEDPSAQKNDAEARQEGYEQAKIQAASFPTDPGVYLMYDREGRVVYVGKALNLKARVRSYFHASGDERLFVRFLESVLQRIEFIVTANEKEAILLEGTLIKKHRPRFNIQLTDDKNYLMIRLDVSRPFPRLETVRRAVKDGARYFGPYHSSRAARTAVRLASRHFCLRTCTDGEMAKRKRPCLQCQMNRCLAPCVRQVDPADYADRISDAVLFLTGRYKELTQRIRVRMEEAAEALEFERAASFRDLIASLEKVFKQQDMIKVDGIDQDIIGLFRKDKSVEICLLEVRSGRVTGRRQFLLKRQVFPDSEVIRSFMGLYYEPGRQIPPEVMTSVVLEDKDAVEELLSERAGCKVRLICPKRGPRRRLLAMATKNAEQSFLRRAEGPDSAELVERLGRRLRLDRLPYRMECFDISNLMGKNPVASMAVFIQGQPSKADYRLFNIEGLEGPDDYQAMRQVLERRFQRAASGEEGWDPPDLLVVDGGKGQLKVALTVLKDLSVEVGSGGVEVIAVAKGPPPASRPVSVESEKEPSVQIRDHIYLARAKNPIGIRGRELLLLSYLRDEAHRFALKHHRRSRRRAAKESDLMKIPGVGPARRKKLLELFGSLDAIAAASLEELLAKGIPKNLADKIHIHFHQYPEGSDKNDKGPADRTDKGPAETVEK